MILKEMWQRIVFRRLEKKFSSQKVPFYLSDYDLWIVSTDWAVEMGNLNYIATEFLNSPIKKVHKNTIGLLYHYKDGSIVDHEHCFEDIIADLINSPERFSIFDFYEEYSVQEIKFLDMLQKKLLIFRS
ncbi:MULTISPECIES: hypothetical protein [Liquorilactobacillus]|uniref:hypothetical protein n=1 Tax=Liquorilactobacillus TaxID=2767888 RepID=UPI001E5D9FE8|nr:MULTISPECIES: hypothetical protein [Liquorilactobacillus]MCC7667179.1 hypothetical protein [Liquorilactobacillus satsumensis]MCP9315004.1 hypothetical protein [Liquorilactobacillus nagelii]